MYTYEISYLTLLGYCGGGNGVYGFFGLELTFFCLTFFLNEDIKRQSN